MAMYSCTVYTPALTVFLQAESSEQAIKAALSRADVAMVYDEGSVILAHPFDDDEDAYDDSEECESVE